jgi:nucleobase:cation symporter-1, NCS1 family
MADGDSGVRGWGGEQLSDEWETFKLEHRGIDLIPEHAQKSSAWNLAGMWAGTTTAISYVVYGALVASFGLSFPQAVLVIVAGNALSYVWNGIASLQGPDVGTTAFMISRAPFGVNANRGVGFFNWVTMVGYEILDLYLVVVTALFLFGHKTIVTAPAGEKVAFILAAAAIQLLLPFLGHATMTNVLKYLFFAFLAAFAIMAVLLAGKIHLPHQSASLAVWSTALALVISTGGLGWANEANDFSRYVPRTTPKSHTFWAATLGPGLPSTLLEVLGVLAYYVSSKALAVTGVPTTFPSWFEIPFLVLVLLQLWGISATAVYSSGVTLQAIGVPVTRWGAVIIDTVICAGVTALVIFKGNFYADLSGFLLYAIVWLAPWFGIFGVDWLLRRGRYDAASLAMLRGGLYWRNGGFHWPAVIAQVTGMVAALLWLNAAFAVPSWTGPISKHLGGSDLSWALGILVGGAVYYVLARSRVRREGDQAKARPERAGLGTA